MLCGAQSCLLWETCHYAKCCLTPSCGLPSLQRSQVQSQSLSVFLSYDIAKGNRLNHEQMLDTELLRLKIKQGIFYFFSHVIFHNAYETKA